MKQVVSNLREYLENIQGVNKISQANIYAVFLARSVSSRMEKGGNCRMKFQ